MSDYIKINFADIHDNSDTTHDNGNGEYPLSEAAKKAMDQVGEYFAKEFVKKACTCGAFKCGNSKHSDWCDLYIKENK